MVKTSCTLVPSDATAIVTAKLGGDAGLLGAAQAFALAAKDGKMQA